MLLLLLLFLLLLFFCCWPFRAFCILYHAISVQPDVWQNIISQQSWQFLLNFGTAHIISTWATALIMHIYLFIFLCFFFFGPISGNKDSREKILIITAPSIFVLLVVTVSACWYFRYLSTRRQPARGQYCLIFVKLYGVSHPLRDKNRSFLCYFRCSFEKTKMNFQAIQEV